MRTAHTIFRVAILSLCLSCFGCDATLRSALSEQQADEIIVALRSENVVASKKIGDSRGQETTYEVLVPPGDVGRALEILRAQNLPRTQEPGLNDIFGTGGLVPTVTEERARFLSALAGELGETIKRIDGVLDARVHLAIPDKRNLVLDENPPQPRASVLIKYQAGALPFDPADIQSLVAGAVEEMPSDNVAVVGVPSTGYEQANNGLVTIGPISVTQGSVGILRMILLGCVVVFIALAVMVLFALRRKGRSEPFEAPPMEP